MHTEHSNNKQLKQGYEEQKSTHIIICGELLILVLMYTHAYSDYVNHILNKSPSKAAYTFTKSSRFPQPKDTSFPSPKDMTYVQEPFLSANGFDFSDGSRHTQRGQQGQNEHSNKKVEKKEGRSQSKSPLRPQRTLHDNFMVKSGKQMKPEVSHKASTAQILSHQRSKSKSPVREKDKLKRSPSKTYTQQLQEVDHPCKNKTSQGYYPIGYQLSPSGRYPISSVKNTPAHSFGKSVSDDRYQYLVKSDDELGPGYYHHYSEFGFPKKCH